MSNGQRVARRAAAVVTARPGTSSHAVPAGGRSVPVDHVEQSQGWGALHLTTIRQKCGQSAASSSATAKRVRTSSRSR